MIGDAAATYFSGHEVVRLKRQDFMKEDFVEEYERADVIMNFAGVPIIKRWTNRNRREIMTSRIETTRKLGMILRDGIKKDRHFIAASAIGIYPDEGIHDENSEERTSGFLKDVVEKWEQQAFSFSGGQSKVAVLRIGVVLSRRGGMLKKILPLFKMGLGGRIGNGKQSFSWIHIVDLIRAVEHIMSKDCKGIYNVVSPEKCNNREFTAFLGKALKKPTFIPVPSALLKLIYGKASDILTGGQAVVPARLMKEGFEFRYPGIEMALRDIVN